MKPFDLEKAKAGEPVCTVEGRDVRIVCWDKRDDANKERAIVALIDDKDRELIYLYDTNGNAKNAKEPEKLKLYMKSGKRFVAFKLHEDDDIHGVALVDKNNWFETALNYRCREDERGRLWNCDQLHDGTVIEPANMEDIIEYVEALEHWIRFLEEIKDEERNHN